MMSERHSLYSLVWLAVLCPVAFSGAGATESTLEVLELKRAVFAMDSTGKASSVIRDGALDIDVRMDAADDWGAALAGGKLYTPGPLALEVEVQGAIDPQDENAFAGIIVDYHSPGGYLKRVAFALAEVSPDRWDAVPAWGCCEAPAATYQLDSDEQGRAVLDLPAHAPVSWDGIVWLTGVVENVGRGVALSVRVPHCVDRRNASMEPERAPPTVADTVDWRLVPLENRAIVHADLTEPQRVALDHFLKRAGHEGDIREGLIVHDRPRLLVGGLSALQDSLSAEEHRRLADQLSDPVPWKEEQGYMLVYFPERDTLVATSLGEMGLVYAIVHLERAVIDGPPSAIALEHNEMLEKPAIETRGIYVNIGYGTSNGLATVDNWKWPDWQAFIDRAVFSRYTFWAFYLWSEIEHVYPDTSDLDLAAKNQRVLGLVRRAIAYGHERGLLAEYLFTPTNIAADIVARHPDWATTLEYVNSGGICSHQPAAYDMALLFHRRQMAFFSEADYFTISFYDPGGCMCEWCRQGDHQLQELVKQVRDFSTLSREISPRARFGFWAWAVWRYERMHDYTLRGRLMPALRGALDGDPGRCVVVDSPYGDHKAVPYFEEARHAGFQTRGFLYQTNIETSNVLLNPLLDFTKQWSAKMRDAGLNEVYSMIMEAETRYPTAHFTGEFLWDADVSKALVTERYGLQQTGSVAAAREMQQGFLLLNDLLYRGHSMDAYGATARAMREHFEQAAAKASPVCRPKIAWLVTMARAYEVLCQAIEARAAGEEERVAELRERFVVELRQAPVFAHYADHLDEGYSTWERQLGWLTDGFKSNHF